MAFGWRVTLDLVQPGEGNTARVPAGMLDDRVVALEALDREATEPQVAADPVLDVHDVIADLHLFEGFEERGALRERRGFVPPAFGEQLVFRDDRERERGRSVPRTAQPQEPAGQLALHQGVRRMRAERRHRLVAQRLRWQIVFQEERLQAIHLATAPGDDHDRALGPQRFEMGEGLGEGSVLDPDPGRLWAVRFEVHDWCFLFGYVPGLCRRYRRDGDLTAASGARRLVGV